MTLPNFLIIGAPKSGTTTLHNVLDQHPDVYMCPVKEVGFFWASGQSVQLTGPGIETLRSRVVNDLDRYQKLFDKATREKAIGESSVRYLEHPRVPLLIRQYIPDAKLIVNLRQPAERAFSAFSHYRRDGLELCPDFAVALAQERQGQRDNWAYGTYLQSGFYFAALKRYLEHFDRQQLHISLLEDLRDDAPGLIGDLFEFIGVDRSFQPDTSHRHNVSGTIRNPVLRFLWTRSGRLRSALRPLFGERFRHAASEWMIRDLEKLTFDPTLRAELTEYYRQDIEQLQDLLQRDLSHWLNPGG